jgi:OOP family OmpA-OmpF porin
MKKYTILLGILLICVGFIFVFAGCATQEEAVREEPEQPSEEIAEEEGPAGEAEEAVVEEEPKEMEVVQRIDSDGDGVYDEEDQCADSPRGTTVDEFGCPQDSDRDGVYNGLDKCPDTVAGVPVDDRGCPTVQPSGKLAMYKVVLEFDSDSSSVRPVYYMRFRDQVEEIKKSHPYLEVLKVEVKGHSDRTGGKKYNFVLSERRAQAVRTYLASQFGVDPGIISVKAFGESDPVASNRTRAGRQKNRRVDIYITVKNLSE